MTKTNRATGKRNKSSKSYTKSIVKAAIELKKTRKRATSDLDSSGTNSTKSYSSDADPPKQRHRKKQRPEEIEVDEEEVGEEEVEVVDSVEENGGGNHAARNAEVSTMSYIDMTSLPT